MVLESKCPLEQEDLSNIVSEWRNNIESIRDMGQFKFLVTFSIQEEMELALEHVRNFSQSRCKRMKRPWPKNAFEGVFGLKFLVFLLKHGVGRTLS
jgi:hypothetical protein